MQMRIPLFYLIDSAGARITDQVRLFPGRNQGGRTFYNQVKMSGVVPQIAIIQGIAVGFCMSIGWVGC